MDHAEILPNKVSQSNTSENNEDYCGAANAVDKDLSTRAATLQDLNREIWLKLEFGKSYVIDKIAIYFMFFANWFGSLDKTNYIQ